MSDNLLDKFATRRKSEPHIVSVTGQEEGDTQDLGYFGVLRGTGERSVMLELRKRDGNIKAVGYAWMEDVDFDASGSLKLFNGRWEITIVGRNLNKEVRPNVRLFESLTRHRVPWLREADEGEAMQAQQQATVIESIAWQERKR